MIRNGFRVSPADYPWARWLTRGLSGSGCVRTACQHPRWRPPVAGFSLVVGSGPSRRCRESSRLRPQPGGLAMRSQFRSVAITAVVALAMVACDGGSSPPAPTVTLTSSVSGVVDSGTLVTLTWSTTHATWCLASGALEPSAGDRRVGGRHGCADVYIYTISCSGSGGVATSSVTITVSGPPSARSAALEEMLFYLPDHIGWSLGSTGTCCRATRERVIHPGQDHHAAES